MKRRMMLRLVLFLVVGSVTVMRLLMSFSLRMWYAPSQAYDDFVPVLQSIWSQSESTPVLLCKNQGYSYWGRMLRFLNLNADLAQFMLWFCAAVLIALVLHVLFRRVWISLLGYIYILWNPVAFENWLGARLYRNSLFAPCLFILISLFILIINHQTPLLKRSKERSISAKSNACKIFSYFLLCVFAGAVTAFLYLLKEDSIWIVPLFVFVVFYKLYLLVKVRQMRTRGANVLYVAATLSMVCVMLSGLCFASLHNQMHYGVKLLNTRTEGEVAGFVERIYQIDSDNQNPTIWAPEDSIEKAFDVSPTLNAIPGFRYGIMHKAFATPDIKVNPLKGDFLGWQIRIVMGYSDQWKDEREVQEIFKRVNSEIDEAFDNGSLKRTSKISIIKSIVPRDIQEILSVIKPSIKAMFWTVDARNVYSVSTNLNNDSLDWENQVGLELYGINAKSPNSPRLSLLSTDNARKIAFSVSRLYVLLNYVLLVAFVATVVYSLIRRRKTSFPYVRMCAFLILMILYAWVYCFTVAWYAEFIQSDYVLYFYTNGSALPFVQTALLIGGGLLYCRLVSHKETID